MDALTLDSLPREAIEAYGAKHPEWAAERKGIVDRLRETDEKLAAHDDKLNRYLDRVIHGERFEIAMQMAAADAIEARAAREAATAPHGGTPRKAAGRAATHRPKNRFKVRRRYV